jgi:dTDP-3-amino-3,4,6-trideoxy-alpha-D-glucose transaminase
MRVPFLDLSSATAQLRAELDASWARVLDLGVFVGGSEVTALEREFEAWLGAGHAAAVGNGLDALAFALQALGIGEGDEVIVPAHTFIATWLAVRMVGAQPVAAEPEEGRFNVSARTVSPLLSARTAAVIVVHMYGEPVEVEPIAELCRRAGIFLVEDAAQAHGAKRNGQAVGTLGDAAAFSFYPAKNLGALGDGGIAVTRSSEAFERICRLRNYGAVIKYDHEIAGRNSRLDTLQAAVLRVKLRHLEAWNGRRREVAARYADGLAGVERLVLPDSLPGNEPVWHLYALRTADRNALQLALADAGIDTVIHYPRAVYRTPPFAAFAPVSTTAADRIASEQLSLPMGPHLRDEQVDHVIQTVRRFFRRSARQPGNHA